MSQRNAEEGRERMCDRGRLLEVSQRSPITSNPLSAPLRLPLRPSALKMKMGSAIALMGGCAITLTGCFAIAFSGNCALAQSNIVPDDTRSTAGSTAGNLTVQTRQMSVRDGAEVTVSSPSGQAGNMTITAFEQNTPNVDPSRGLGDLPTDVVDGTRLIDNRCTPAGAAQRSSFVITGRGGIPPSPNEPLQGESVITDWVTLNSEVENTNTVPKANPARSTPKPLVEAQSWVYGANGEVILTAQSPTVTPYKSWQTSPSCDAVGREEKEVF